MNISARNINLTSAKIIGKKTFSLSDFKIAGSNVKNDKTPAKNEKGNRNEKAATVDISQKGRELLDSLNEKEKIIKKNIKETRDSESKVNDFISRVNKGEELTAEEKEFLNDELQTMASKDYYKKTTHILTDKDVENALLSMKENYRARLDMYSKLQEEIESEKSEAGMTSTERKFMDVKEIQDKGERIKAILEKSLEDIDEEDSESDEKVSEENVDSKDKTIDGSDEDTETVTTVDKEADDKQAVVFDSDVVRADKIIDRNKKLIDNIKTASEISDKDTRIAQSKMDDEFLKISDILSNDEISEDEKIREFDSFKQNMKEFSSDKMLAEVKHRFDAGTWLIGRIEKNSHDDIHEVLKSQNPMNGNKGINMVRDFLIGPFKISEK